MTYPADVKLQAKELRLAGYTLREIEQKLGVTDGTIHNWTSDDGAQASLIRQQRKFEADQDLTLEATKRVSERIPLMEDKDLIRAYHASTMANHGALRILQDERKANTMIEELRRLLRAKDPATLRAELSTQSLVTEPVIQVMPESTEP